MLNESMRRSGRGPCEVLAAASLLLSSIFILIFHSNTYFQPTRISNPEGANPCHLHPLDCSHHETWIARKVVGVGFTGRSQQTLSLLACENRLSTDISLSFGRALRARADAV